MAVTVHLKHLRVSTRKVRVEEDVISGMKIDQEIEQLNYIPKLASTQLIKLVQSGIAAAEHDFKMDKNDLYISKIIVEEGPTLKRSMPRAMGRAFRIAKRTSHITLVLDKKIGSASQEALQAIKKSDKEEKGNKKELNKEE